MQNPYSDSVLTINLSSIEKNYSTLKQKSANAQVAAVVKANAYGLGVKQVAMVLSKAGCDNFFVATLDEGIQLRGILPEAFIGVFHGVSKSQEEVFAQFNLTPVLNSLDQINIWQSKKLPSILHIDTGMNRLGLSIKDAQTLVNKGLPKNLDIKYIMSHLACSSTPDHKKNKDQLEKLLSIKNLFPGIGVSFASSYGVFLGKDYHFDLVRPGAALYGINPTPNKKNPMALVVSLTSKIIQIRKIDTADTVGYGASCKLPAGSKIAVVPLGYADGYFRSLSNKGFCIIGNKKVPVIGRVSMDLITIDVTSLDNNKLNIGEKVEIIGNNITVDDVATAAGTIGYEVITNLGCRYKRVYL